MRRPATGARTIAARAAAALLAALLAGACATEARPPAGDSAAPEERVANAAPTDASEEAPESADSVAVMAAQLTIVAYGPDDEPAVVALSVTDPLSRTTGVAAPGGRSFESIPNSRYELAGVQRDSAAASAETAPLVTVSGPIAGTWTAQVVSPSASRYRIDVRAAHDDGTGRRASGPWEEIGAGETRRWRITYDPRDPGTFALDALP